MLNTRGCREFSENLISEGLLNGESEFFQKFKNLGNGRGVVKNIYVEVMKILSYQYKLLPSKLTYVLY